MAAIRKFQGLTSKRERHGILKTDCAVLAQPLHSYTPSPSALSPKPKFRQSLGLNSWNSFAIGLNYTQTLPAQAAAAVII